MLFDYRTLLESSEDILVTITSRDDRIMETSGAINLLGFTPGEAVGSVHKKFPVGSYYHRQHKSGEKLTCQCLLTADHGQGSFILEKIIKNDYGDTMSSTGSFSFNQAAEDEANRKILLQQTALKEAQIKAQAEIEFTSFLAHEVRNPLSGIDSSIQLLSSTLSTFRNDILSKCSMQDAVSVFTVPSASIEQMRMDIDQGLKDVTHVVSCVKYIQMILTNTLDLAKIDMGKFNLQKTKINLFQDIVSPCLMMLENQKSDRVDVRIECDPEIHITGDPFRLTQAIMNLVENSMRFTKVGYVLLQVRVVPPPGRTQPKKWLPDEGKWIQIRVEDTGPHVPKELQDDVFSKYSVRRYTRQASSVAMSLAKKLFNAMGGDVFMDDQFVSGSAVVVHIPGGFLEAYKPLEVKEVGMYGGVDTADVDTTLVSISTMADGTTETSNPNTPKEGKTTNFSLDLSGGSDRGEEGDESILKHLRVLVVDDSKAACKLLLRRLQSCVRGYWNTKNAVIAHTAEQALELCKTFDFSFDVVIIDQNMQPAGGTMLGSDAVQVMRQQLKMVKTVVIGCTGVADSDGHAFMEAGADKVWGKPMPHTREMIQDMVSGRVARLGPNAAQLPGCKKVLLVDDSKMNCRVLIRRMKLAFPPSWELLSRTCAEDVIDDIRRGGWEYDIVITDEYLGGPSVMTGSEFMIQLREAGYKGLLIGCSAQNLLDLHLQCGADLSWIKPAPSNEIIITHLMHFLDRLRANCSESSLTIAQKDKKERQAFETRPAQPPTPTRR